MAVRRGCAPRERVELWTTHGAGHIPALTARLAPTVYDFLDRHPKP